MDNFFKVHEVWRTEIGGLTDYELSNQAVHDYNSGWRAYVRKDGTTFYKLPDGSQCDSKETGKHHLQQWSALRAYQDEQRKKGVPILLRTLSDDDKWRRLRNGYRTPNRPVYFGSYLDRENPETDCEDMEDGPRRPYIKLYTESGADLALFCNFRWREGYPKGGQHAS